MNMNNAAEAAAVATAEEIGLTKKHPVMEIFGPTIQGEGLVAGQQTLFIRFGGCDYRCQKCDSLHAVIPSLVQQGATYMGAEEIGEKLKEIKDATGVRWVTFSGGNPAIHQLGPLVEICHGLGFAIAIETQGTIWADWLPDCDVVTVSPKGPGMGEKFKPELFERFMENLLGHPGFNVKIVIMDKRDIEFAKYVAYEWSSLQEPDMFWLSLGNPFPPRIDGTSDDFRINDLRGHYIILLEELMQEKQLRFARILPQVHVLVWGNKKGV